MRRHGKQTELGAALKSTVGRLDKRSKGAYQQVLVAETWVRVAGPSAAEHTTGAHIRDGELIVRVDSPVWATELSALSEMYREALNKEIGKELIEAVRFTVSPQVDTKKRELASQAEDDEFYAKDDTPPIPLTPQERAQIEQSVSEIPDEQLRQAVLGATIADLEWKKGIAARQKAQDASQGL